VCFDVRCAQLDEATTQQEKSSASDADDVRAKIADLTEENRSLKRSLTDAHTSLALQRSEVANVRAQCEEKCYELNKYVRPPYCRDEMYAGRVACCPW